MSQKNRSSRAQYQVFVDDNFDFMDEDARHCVGRFDSYEEALAVAKRIVESAVRNSRAKTAVEILSDYKDFGDDPFIVVPGGQPEPEEKFSAWKYAEEYASKVADERAG